MSSHGRIDVNANTHGIKQTTAKGNIRKKVKEIINGTGSVAYKKKELTDYLVRQKSVTFKIIGDNLTLVASGEYSTSYTYPIKEVLPDIK